MSLHGILAIIPHMPALPVQRGFTGERAPYGGGCNSRVAQFNKGYIYESNFTVRQKG